MRCEHSECNQQATKFASVKKDGGFLPLDTVVARCREHFRNYEQFLKPGKTVQIVEISEQEALVLKVQES